MFPGLTFPIYSPDGRVFAERLKISKGTMSILENPEIKKHFRDWSRIPKQPWQLLTSKELEIVTTVYDDDNADILIIEFPMELISNIRSCLGTIESHETEEDFTHLMTNDKYLECIGNLEKYVDRFGEITKKPLVCIKRPGLITTTTDDSLAMIGLHVDSWYSLKLEERINSPNRICINIGKEPRYLLLLNLTLGQIFDFLNKANKPQLQKNIAGTPMALSFMREFPEYPIIRLRVDPGEGYLAPTENMVHDGSTLGMTSWDLAVHILGYFAVRA